MNYKIEYIKYGKNYYAQILINGRLYKTNISTKTKNQAKDQLFDLIISNFISLRSEVLAFKGAFYELFDR